MNDFFYSALFKFVFTGLTNILVQVSEMTTVVYYHPGSREQRYESVFFIVFFP